jgi:hypothetical protein
MEQIFISKILPMLGIFCLFCGGLSMIISTPSSYRMLKFIKNKRLVNFLPFLVLFESTYYGRGKKYYRKSAMLFGIALFFGLCAAGISLFLNTRN